MRERITHDLLQAARAYRLRSAKLLGRIGLYPGQDAFLMLLNERGRMTMGEAAAALAIQPPTVTKMVSRLATAGLVQTEVMEGDRRKIAITMTEAARQKAEEIDAIWEELEAQALSELDAEPLKALLAAIVRNLSR